MWSQYNDIVKQKVGKIFFFFFCLQQDTTLQGCDSVVSALFAQKSGYRVLLQVLVLLCVPAQVCEQLVQLDQSHNELSAKRQERK